MTSGPGGSTTLAAAAAGSCHLLKATECFGV